MIENSFQVEGKKIKFKLINMGEDLVLIFMGGDQPHVGAVSIGIPRSSLQDPEELSSTVSNYTFVGHKDYVLSNMCADYLAKNLNRKIVVCGGVHFDQITAELIKEITKKTKEICKSIIKSMKDDK